MPMVFFPGARVPATHQRFDRGAFVSGKRTKCVLAYSGGLDTSVILGWLIERGYDVIAVYVDLGQPCEDRAATLEKARTCGAIHAEIVDVREELCRDFAFPVLQWQASNVQVKTDDAGNVKPTKKNSSSTGRIDGMVALIMALGIASGEARNEPDEPMLMVF
jgi:hypothetical protein